jgi:hypothetical protein
MGCFGLFQVTFDEFHRDNAIAQALETRPSPRNLPMACQRVWDQRYSQDIARHVGLAFYINTVL